ncbi:MAG: hypothetical protein RBS78_02780 [Coriobacteriia bacterium]|jgi:hypothetical protein|nr:hypothetical protein [Coriobacteriia bacterium]
MWVITHTFTGLALGAVLAEREVSLWFIVPAALLLHLLLDLVPHWDYVRERSSTMWAAGDLTAAVVALVTARMVGGFAWPVLITGAVSALPDLDVLNTLWTSESRIRFFPSHWTRFPHGSAAPVPGTIIQAVFCAVSIAIMVVV